ncbi:MAG: septum formation inhibitor Maf [Vicingaceae bacterium]|nr:septum formation inhibitor Maf [Vicingaceae bacterium]
MKSTLKFITIIGLLSACSFTNPEKQTEIIEKTSTAFNNYWFNNEAEITSYKLEQARYGEIRQGNAVLIYVTEPFSKEKQVKADNPTPNDFLVLKLNFTKKFNTGIYPYSMMNSLFLPIDDLSKPLIKATSSAQEWCGHAFTQLNQRKNKWNVNSFSYFESEGDNTSSIPNDVLEDEIWLRIRTNPEMLPTGKTKLIPSLFYVRLMHKELKAYRAEISTAIEKNLTIYSIYYPELERTLTIHYQNVFPYAIESWEETYVSGWGDKAEKLTTKATKINTLKNAYWTKNAVKDSLLRKELGL